MRQTIIPNMGYGNCYKLTLRHFSVNKKPQGDVGTVPVTRAYSDDVGGVDALVSQVVAMAQEDANNLHSGIQTYGVFAHFKDDQNYTPRCMFRVAAQEEYDPETSAADPSEPANERGLISQLMRHNEAIMRNSVMQSSYLLDTLRQENASQRELLQSQAEQSIEMAALIQETMDNATARRISERESETKQGMMTSVFEHLKLIFPVMLNKLAGQKIAPETDQSFQLLAGFFESLSQEQQQALIANLNPAQGAIFAEFLDTYERRKKAITSSDSPGPKINLAKLFDPIKEQVDKEHDSNDPKLARMEGHVKSFRDVFKTLPAFKGPIKPAKP